MRSGSMFSMCGVPAVVHVVCSEVCGLPPVVAVLPYCLGFIDDQVIQKSNRVVFR